MRKKLGRGLLKLFSSTAKQTSYSIKNYQTAPIQNLSVLFSSAGCIVSLIGFVIALVSFIIGGGYTLQISNIKVNDVDYALSCGNVAILYKGIIAIIVVICIIAGMSLLIASFLREASSTKRVLMITDLVLMMLFLGITKIYDAIIRRKIDFTEKQLNALRKFFSAVNYQTISIILLTVLFLTICFCIALIFFSKQKRMLTHICKSVFISFVLFPFFLILLENLVALIAMVIVCVLIVAMIFIISKAIDDATLGGSGGAGPVGSNHAAPPKPKKKKDVKGPRVIEVSNGARLYIEEGKGIFAPATTCIFTDTPFLNNVFLCTLKDFKAGKVIIIKGGKTIQHI